jgi:hypothetical protein
LGAQSLLKKSWLADEQKEVRKKIAAVGKVH